MSGQLELAVLPVAEPVWARAREREAYNERRHDELVAFAGRVIEAGERSDFFGYASTPEVVAIEVEFAGMALDYDEAPEAFRRCAMLLRECQRRGLLEHLPWRVGRHRGGYWGRPS